MPAVVHGADGRGGVLHEHLLLVHRQRRRASVVCSTPFRMAVAPQVTLALCAVTVSVVGVGAAAAGAAATAAATSSGRNEQ